VMTIFYRMCAFHCSSSFRHLKYTVVPIWSRIWPIGLREGAQLRCKGDIYKCLSCPSVIGLSQQHFLHNEVSPPRNYKRLVFSHDLLLFLNISILGSPDISLNVSTLCLSPYHYLRQHINQNGFHPQNPCNYYIRRFGNRSDHPSASGRQYQDDNSKIASSPGSSSEHKSRQRPFDCNWPWSISCRCSLSSSHNSSNSKLTAI